MQIDLNNLPSDTDTLHRLVQDLASVMTHRDEEIERLQGIIKKLRCAERFDPDQLDLALEDLEQDIARTETAQCSFPQISSDSVCFNKVCWLAFA